MINFDPMRYTINDFREWEARDELILSPKFQRRSVWSAKAQSYLMDTIIRGLPLPKIYMRHDIDIMTKRSRREIVDGQQRIRAILNFLDDGFRILKVHNKEHHGVFYSDLPDEMQKCILQYNISVDILIGATDAEVLDVFARLNTYTVVLKQQEKLNAKYSGAFKQTVYALGYQFKDFFVNNKILTERKIARMAEAELSSELVVQILDGPQDRKLIESYYKRHDDHFRSENTVKKRFEACMDKIAEIYGEHLSDSHFRNVPLFYTLFGAINDLITEQRIPKSAHPKIRNVLLDTDDILDRDPQDIPKAFINFYDSATKHVTDLKARKLRHRFIKSLILKAIK